MIIAMLGTAMLALLTEHGPSLTCSLAAVVQVALSLMGVSLKNVWDAVAKPLKHSVLLLP